MCQGLLPSRRHIEKREDPGDEVGDDIFPPKPLKSKNKKHAIFWNTKFYHPAKFELKRIKNAKVVPMMHF